MKILSSYIHLDHSGFLEHRYFCDSIRRVINLIEFTKHLGTSTVALFIDTERAFEHVEWGFLKYTLVTFTFAVD